MKPTHNVLASLGIMMSIVAAQYFTDKPSSPSRYSSAGLVFEKTPLIVEEIAQFIPNEKWRELFKGRKDSVLVLDIYPQKDSKDPSKKDFSLLVLLRDRHGKLIESIPNISSTTFKQRSKYYIVYAKSTKNENASIPYGYQVIIHKNKIGLKNNVQLKVLPQLNKATVRMDSCRIPPGCSTAKFSEISTISTDLEDPDSCRIPPGCLFPLINETVMRDLLKTTAKKKSVR